MPFRAEGDRKVNDSAAYQGNFIVVTTTINEAQFNTLLSFGNNPAAFGFTPDYRGLANSCIDFTWHGLMLVGINPSGFQGFVLPTQNTTAVVSAIADFAISGANPYVISFSGTEKTYTFENGAVYKENIASGYRIWSVPSPDGQKVTTWVTTWDATKAVQNQPPSHTVVTETPVGSSIPSKVSVIDVDVVNGITTTQTDSNADGLFETIKTAYDANFNGINELEIKVNNGTTTYRYDANQNGQFENITVAQANGRFDITQTDESGAAAPWKTIETHYASAGVLDDQRIVWDNNSTWLNDWDQAASQSWRYQSTQYTASGQADLQTIDCDATGKSFDLSTTVYAPTGAVDWQTVRMDNGSGYCNDWNQTNNQDWKLITTYTDAWGRYDNQTVQLDGDAY